MRICKCQGLQPNSPGVIYCGRAWGGWTQSLLHNPHTSHGKCRPCNKSHSKEEAIQLYRQHLHKQLTTAIQSNLQDAKTDWECLAVWEMIAGLEENAVLGCWCVEKSEPLSGIEQCHCEVIIKAARWIRSLK